MRRARLPLLLSSVLAMAACTGEERSGASAAPPGFELAMAGLADGAQADGDERASGQVIALAPKALAARLAAGAVRLIDVRTEEEVAEGLIPGAEHIPLERFDPGALDLSDGRAVVLYCRSGRRSQIAGEKLAAALGQSVEHLEGGILAWEAAGQPITKR
ncbi:MAG: rhodanese-like domain-containing protein [Erythrobacter cryptus]